MSFSLGAQVPLKVTVTDPVIGPVNAASVTITIIQPDGTPVVLTTAGATVTNPSVGVYLAYFVPTMAGWHQWSGVSVGPASAYGPDSFTMIGSTATATLAPLVSLAETREHLGVSTTATDAQLLSFALAATEICESGKGTNRVWRRQSVTDVFDGFQQSQLVLTRRRVLSVTSVTENGVALASGTDYVLDPVAGILIRGSSLGFGPGWLYGRQNISALYVVGVNGAIPEAVRLGVKELIKHLWDTQRGGSNLPRQQGNDGAWDPRQGYTVPRRVKEIWGPYKEPNI